MQADDAERSRGATAVAATAAGALVGPYPIDEDALRKLKRLHDDGGIDEHTFKCRKAEALGLAEPTAFADARSMDVDAIVDDAPGEDDAASVPAKSRLRRISTTRAAAPFGMVSRRGLPARRTFGTRTALYCWRPPLAKPAAPAS